MALSKRQLTQAIQSQKAYLYDCEEEIKNQNPQKDGSIYLHGDVIAIKSPVSGRVYPTSILIKAKNELEELVKERLSLNSNI